MRISRLGVLVVAVLAAAAPSARAGQPSAATMKAIRYHEFGGPSVLKYEDAPRPTPKANEVLIKVYAAGVNPVDWKIRAGKVARGVTLPVIPGFDASGVIEEVGAEVKDFKKGDEVFAFTALPRGGAYAEYCVALPNEVARKPASIDHVRAAGVPLAALTAWQALFDAAKLRPGQTVLVHAGAGGVGHFAIQLAKAKGAKVIATASAGNLAFLKELGADQAIDYKAQKFDEIVKDVDVVLDSIGGETLNRSYAVVKEGGYVVSIVQAPDPEKLKARNLKGSNMLVKPNTTQLAEIAALIDAGKVKPTVGETFKLEDAAKAHELSETGHARGKIVLKVR